MLFMLFIWSYGVLCIVFNHQLSCHNPSSQHYPPHIMSNLSWSGKRIVCKGNHFAKANFKSIISTDGK